MSDEEELEQRQKALFNRFRLDFEFYAPRALRIRPKIGGVKPFRLNQAQLAVHQRIEAQRAKGKPVRVVILKGRQQGISTYVQGRFFWRLTHTPGFRAFILTHMDSTTDNLFGMVSRFIQHCPPELRPVTGTANAKELSFSELESGYKVATAGAKGVGVGDTLQLFHGCLGLDTPVVCSRTGSLRRMGDLAVGDMVRTHTGEVAPISFISQQTKPVYSVKLKGLQDFPLVSTGEHRFWTREGFQTLDMIRKLLRLEGPQYIGFPVFDVTDEITSFRFALPPPVRPQGGGIVENVPAVIPPTYALGRIVGLYLAEGCILRQSNIFRRPTGLILTVHEREVQRTMDWLREVGGIYSTAVARRKAESQGFNITVSGRSLTEWMLNLVGEKAGKQFPTDWHRMGASFVRGLVHGYLAGDGHSSAERDRRISLTSVRSATVVGLRDALASLGYGWAGISHKEAGERHGRQEQEAWTLRLTGPGVDVLSAELGWSCPPRKRVGSYGAMEVSGGYAWVPVLSIDEAGEKPVRDFEVDHPDHSYCVMQGATHNSEVSKWPNAESHVSGALQAVPYEKGTEVILESTSDGPVGIFYETCIAAERGESDYEFIFIPWYAEPGYRRELSERFEPTSEELDVAAEHGLDWQQLAWRRAKISELRGLQEFRRQYPATVPEAWKIEAIGALWKRAMLDTCRVGQSQLPQMARVVVAIDPSGGAGKNNDEVGIIVAGRGVDGFAYVLADHTGKFTPSGWAKKAIALYEVYQADRIVAERNFGGDMVENTVRAENDRIPFKDVVASRGKMQRAEPVVALYEKGSVFHLGLMAKLEDELVTWVPGQRQKSPNRLDAMVWAVTDLMLGDDVPYDSSMQWVSGADTGHGATVPAF